MDFFWDNDFLSKVSFLTIISGINHLSIVPKSYYINIFIRESNGPCVKPKNRVYRIMHILTSR
jgi:hypothetical protein